MECANCWYPREYHGTTIRHPDGTWERIAAEKHPYGQTGLPVCSDFVAPGPKPMTLPVTLKPEYSRLYQESPTFKQGVDAFITGVLPFYFDGLAAHAAKTDEEMEIRKQEMAMGLLSEDRWRRQYGECYGERTDTHTS